MELLLRLYLMHAGHHVEHVTRQFDFDFIMTQACLHVRKLREKETDNKILSSYARVLLGLCCKYFLCDVVEVPLSPRWVAQGVEVEECRVFSSKMAPMKIVLRNVDQRGSSLALIIKLGDDLRQDALTLQVCVRTCIYVCLFVCMHACIDRWMDGYYLLIHNHISNTTKISKWSRTRISTSFHKIKCNHTTRS